MRLKNAVYVALGIYPGGQARTAVEVRAQQNLAALRALGYEITIITTRDPLDRPLDGKVVLVDPLPVPHFVSLNTRWRYRRKMQKLVAQLTVGSEAIIICEHLAALVCAPRHPRVVYSFHDFESNLMIVRRSRKASAITWKTRVYWRLAAWMECCLLRRANRVICVSASEAAKLRTSLHADVEYIPTVPFTEPPACKEVKPGPLRIWFYGNSGATSNKIMLDHLISELFAQLSDDLPSAEFHQLGAYDTYDAEKIDWLHRHFRVHGFVEDPAKLFQPGDICLMPYQRDTGFRTKIPEVCGYGMISAGYEATFACCPEMRDGYNCVIARDPAQLVERLAQLQADVPARRRMATNAIDTRRREFSFTALLERYRRILDF